MWSTTMVCLKTSHEIVTVNDGRYRNTLELFRYHLENIDLGWTEVLTAQSGRSHNRRNNDFSNSIVSEMFNPKMIAVSWPTKPWDLTPCAFFWWRYLETRDYANKSNSSAEVKSQSCHRFNLSNDLQNFWKISWKQPNCAALESVVIWPTLFSMFYRKVDSTFKHIYFI